MAGVAPKAGTSTHDHGDEHHHAYEQEHGNERDHGNTGHSHDDHDHDENAHSNITAVYAFDCEGTDALSAVSFVGGTLPFALEEINLMWVTDTGQGAATLRPGNIRAEWP